MDYLRQSRALVPASTSLFANGQPQDLIALADLKLELNLTETADDAYLSKLITRASAAAARFCNRIFVPTLWRDDIAPASGPYPWELPPALQKLRLAQWPVIVPSAAAGSLPVASLGVAPPPAPVVVAVANANAPNTPQTYYVRLTYLTPQGETAASLETPFQAAAGQGFTIASPPSDPTAQATGYRVYWGVQSYAQTQASGAALAPIALGQAFAPTFQAPFYAFSPPADISVVEGAPNAPAPLAEGLDFTLDATTGQLLRLWSINGHPKPWSLPVSVVYSAGYATIPDDLQEAVVLLAKMRWFARTRDPMVRSRNVEGVMSSDYWLGTGLGGQGDLPVDVTEKLDRYRVTVVA